MCCDFDPVVGLWRWKGSHGVNAKSFPRSVLASDREPKPCCQASLGHQQYPGARHFVLYRDAAFLVLFYLERQVSTDACGVCRRGALPLCMVLMSTLHDLWKSSPLVNYIFV